MEEIRIQKYISDSGVMSRRAAEQEIINGRVTVNGKKAEIGQKVDPERDIVKIGQKVVSPRKNKSYTYIMLNKPAGYVTTMSDEKGRPCVADLVADVGRRVYPVGRLDCESEGLLIMTDDGALANKLMHPSGHIPKVYHVKSYSDITPETLKKLSQPMDIDGYTTKPADISVVTMNDNYTVLRIVLQEGRNRQIRRMFEKLDLDIKYLRRVAVGDIRLGNLKRGEWRKLSAAQIRYLKNY